MRVFINGFGRIGRSVLRAWAQAPDAWPGLAIVGINDIEAPEMLAYLFEYDSVFGPWKGSVAFEDGALVIDGRRVALHRAEDISGLDLSGVDLVMECTGRAETPEIAGQGLAAGARRVLISGPSGAAEATIVLGANEDSLGAQRVVSNASCTTNALAPLARLLDREFGIVTGSMTTVHCYTGSQPTVDKPRGPMERSRAAALSMVPTTTSAGTLMEAVLPGLAGRLVAQAVRVPTASVSAVDLAVTVARPASVEAVNAVLREAGGVIGITEKPLVSTDLRARPESVVMALPETRATAHGLIRVFGWYDNEWGFSNRMLDMALRMG
ncbi:type I glyceraldehyde-3-phosphate dehydrogenase [Thioclava atlantica]|uniref:Glyceraldehyde-3-phosphate dehydrogenase, type I n=1 Tax=Thioclava atlantica TaxID=1317124 RepID=A0A085TSV7_9RHOB|nr:glyceraldehyde 3-phosphate dehydrogenase NAD-binding domain-containing protein [Thioclava atlantica]KFE33804.1 glyceraldehyde-3-phosphate dehydrogenase, type I [Thioclava atlantica]